MIASHLLRIVHPILFAIVGLAVAPVVLMGTPALAAEEGLMLVPGQFVSCATPDQIIEYSKIRSLEKITILEALSKTNKSSAPPPCILHEKMERHVDFMMRDPLPDPVEIGEAKFWVSGVELNTQRGVIRWSLSCANAKGVCIALAYAQMLTEMMHQQLQAHWHVDAGHRGYQLPSVIVSWRLSAGGMLEGEPQVVSPQINREFRIAAEAATRAIKAAQPFKFPIEKFADWHDNTWKFDPSELAPKLDPDKLAGLLNKSPGNSPPKALIDKSQKPTGAKPTGDSKTATNLGPFAGTAQGRDNVLSAIEADMLNTIINTQLTKHWRLPAGGGGTQTPIVAVRWTLKPDGTLDGEPQVLSPQNNPMFQVAAEAAVRAIKAAQPFKLPPEKYANWRDNTWKFDPSKML